MHKGILTAFRNSDNVKNIVVKYTGALFALGLQLTLVRLLTVDTYGYYVQAIAVVNIFATACAFGQQTYLNKRISILNFERDQNGINNEILSSHILIFIALTIVVIIASTILPLSADSSNVIFMTENIPYLCISIFLIAYGRCLAGIARGYGLVLAENTSISIGKPLFQFICAFVLFLVVVGGKLSLQASLLALIVAQAIHLLFLSLYVYVKRPTFFYKVAENRVKKFDLISLKKISESAQFTFLNIMTAIEKNVDIIIVGLLVGPKMAAIYSICTRIYSIAMMSQAALSAVFASKAANAYAAGNLKDLKRRYNYLTSFNFIISLSTFIVCVLFGEMILEIFSTGFKTGYMALLVLTGAGLARALAGPANVTANMVGAQFYSILVVIVTIIVGIFAMYFFTKLYGIEGTALGLALMVVGRAFILRIVLRTRYHI